MTEASPEAWGVVITAIAALDYLNRLTNAEIEALNQPRLGAADRRKTGVVQVSLRVRELFGEWHARATPTVLSGHRFCPGAPGE